MRGIGKLLGAAVLSLSFLAAAPVTQAATQTFEFKLDAATVAFGSFSYADGAAGVLSFADLSAFTFSVNVPAIFQGGAPRMFTYSLTDVLGFPAGPIPAGRYFGYDTATNSFVSTVDAGAPALPWFGGGNAHVTMAAYSSSPDQGFMVDWRAPGTDPASKSGIMAMQTIPGEGTYSGIVNWNNYTISPVSEPSSIALAAAGLAIIGFMASKRRRT